MGIADSKFMMQRMIAAATIALLLLTVVGRPSQAGATVASDQKADTRPAAKTKAPDNLETGDLVWTARHANMIGKYDEALRDARAATQRADARPDVLCSAWMNVFYAAHRSGDKVAAAAACKAFETPAARLPRNDPVVMEMAELKAALGFGEAVALPAALAPAEGDGFWQSADPGALGLDAGAIAEHLSLAQKSGADAVMVACRGKVVSEWYSPRYRTPAATMSSVKSITGLLVGLLIADGKLTVDDPVSRFIPAWADPTFAGRN
jgi:hypothetical protein